MTITENIIDNLTTAERACLTPGTLAALSGPKVAITDLLFEPVHRHGIQHALLARALETDRVRREELARIEAEEGIPSDDRCVL